jgi:hypothetical protein
MASWLPFDLKRRGFLGAGLLAAGAAAIGGRNALGQAEQTPSAHQGHQMSAGGKPQYDAGNHLNAHGEMIPVGDVD